MKSISVYLLLVIISLQNSTCLPTNVLPYIKDIFEDDDIPDMTLPATRERRRNSNYNTYGSNSYVMHPYSNPPPYSNLRPYSDPPRKYEYSDNSYKKKEDSYKKKGESSALLMALAMASGNKGPKIDLCTYVNGVLICPNDNKQQIMNTLLLASLI